MRTNFIKQGAIAAAALLLSAGLANAEEIGATVKVVNAVTATLDSNLRTLAMGDGVNQNELIVTGTDAISEFKFKDDTKLALGPGAQLKLDKFVYDPAKADGTIGVELVKGAFRFMTGIAKKPAYTISTPTATIAVRGTIFDLYVQRDGTTWLLLHEGAITMCNKRGKCRDLDETSKMMRVTRAGDVGIPICWTGLPGNESVPFETAFPFVVSPPSIDAKPIYVRDDIVRSECTTPERITPPTPPVRRTNYQPEAPRQYKRVEREPVIEYTKPSRPKAKPLKEASIPYEPPQKVKPKRPRADDDDDYVPPKRKPPKITKVDIPDIKIKIKKPKYPRRDNDDNDDDYERPKKQPKRYTNDDGEVAKKIIGLGIGLAIGGFGKKSHNGDYGDSPRGRRGSYGD